VKTLLLHEVRDLIAVAIISKLMAPLLCEYTNKFRMVFQKMLEMQLFNIISHLNIFKHPIIERCTDTSERSSWIQSPENNSVS